MCPAIADSAERAPVAEWPAWPTYALIDDLLPTLTRWAERGEPAALATLVSVVGSSPRPLGSEMAVSGRGEVAGYVSGGCVEGAVAAEARGVIERGEPVTLDYGAGSPVLDVQLTCGGRIGIFVRALPDLAAYVERLTAARADREPLAVSIDLETGDHCFDASTDGANTFRKVYRPPPRLIVAGSDPVTLALCRTAPMFGFEVGLLRPYGPGTPPPDTPLFNYDTRPLARALDDLAVDADTAVYTLTHDIDDDHAVLLRALDSPAFAIGALGSRHKIGERNARLAAAGVAEKQIARINTPAGLEIGAKNPSEIALSVIAQLIAGKHGATAAA